MIAETNQIGQMLAEYVYIGDQLLAMIKPGELVYYFHNDHLGTPQVLTNDSQAISIMVLLEPLLDSQTKSYRDLLGGHKRKLEIPKRSGVIGTQDILMEITLNLKDG